MAMKEGAIERIYAEAGREIRSMLLVIEPKSMTADKALAIERRARTVVAGLTIAAGRWAHENLGDAYKLSGKRARVSLEVLGQKNRKRNFQGGLDRLQTSALKYLLMANGSIRKSVERYLHLALVGGNMLRNLPVQHFSYTDAEGEFGDWAGEALRTEQPYTWLQNKIMNSLHALIEDDMTIEVAGKWWSVKAYAEMVARTELRNAQTQATKDLCNEYENDLVEFSWHETSCDECKPFEKQVFSLSGTDPDYEALTDDNTPPIHPNCKHSILPTSREAIEARGIFG